MEYLSTGSSTTTSMTPEVLHIGHPGMSKMKSLAHTINWWLKLDTDIEKMV